MSGFEDKYPDNIKKFLLSEESKHLNIILRQNKIIENISKNQKLDEYSNIEYYNEIPYDNDILLEKCEEILQYLPIKYFEEEFIGFIKNIDLEGNDIDNVIINYGDRISLDNNHDKKFEEWRNVLSNDIHNNILFSLHKIFIPNKYEIKITYKFETYILEINFKRKNIHSIKFTKNQGIKKYIYLCTQNENNSEIITALTFEDEEEKSYESKNECLYYELDNNKIDSIFNQSDDKQNPIIVNKVDTQSIKKNTNSDYYEKNYETYNIDKLFSWGKKIYENNKNRNYKEEWEKTKFEEGGYELKCHKFLDDGYGKKTSEEYGRKCDRDNNLEYEYTDTYIYNVTNGDELTTKKGFDKYNKWDCRNFRNIIRDFSHVENIASNHRDKMEWKETWDEEKNIKKCKKWGKSEDEEWEESWVEKYNPENDDKIKECYKKCKKLKYDREWYETWTEKNNGKSNCEKTCYKMNKENGNKYENYWGNIIVNYLDNKRMNYVGYANNDNKNEYISYTYQNTNN